MQAERFGQVERTCGQAGHDCNGRFRRHRRIQNAMFTEAGPDSDHRLGKDFADVKAGKAAEIL